MSRTKLNAGNRLDPPVDLTRQVIASPSREIPLWTVLAPLIGGVIALGVAVGVGGYFAILVVPGLAIGVFAAIHHAETVALRIGEPYGTLVLALSVTLLELSLVGSVMLIGPRRDTAALARDTVFATVMILLNGIVGLSLLVGRSASPRSGILSRRGKRGTRRISGDYSDDAGVPQLY